MKMGFLMDSVPCYGSLLLLPAYCPCFAQAKIMNRHRLRTHDTAADNPVSKLIDEMKVADNCQVTDRKYRLQALLTALKIPVSSQVLVVSHTSLQSDRINPVNPRAIYFNDDITLGFVPDGLIELTVLDPKLGTAFYIMENDPDEHHLPEREINRCVMCHVSNLTRNVPGLQIRSVHVNAAGAPNFRFGGSRVDHTTELSKRWGAGLSPEQRVRSDIWETSFLRHRGRPTSAPTCGCLMMNQVPPNT